MANQVDSLLLPSGGLGVVEIFIDLNFSERKTQEKLQGDQGATSIEDTFVSCMEPYNMRLISVKTQNHEFHQIITIHVQSFHLQDLQSHPVTQSAARAAVQRVRSSPS